MVTKRGFWKAIQGQAKVVRPPDRRFSVESNYPYYNLFIIIVRTNCIQLYGSEIGQSYPLMIFQGVGLCPSSAPDMEVNITTI